MFGRSCIRLHARLHLNYGFAGLLDRTPELSPNSCQQRSSVGSAFFSGENFDFVTVYISLNLTP